MNKFHRYNHHSYHIPRVPDAGYDPIASRESPFRGEFVLSGMLSAISPFPADAFSIVTDALYSPFISAENITVTDTINAYYMNVEYIDVTVAEVSGFTIQGAGTQPGGYINIPSTPWVYDVLTLSSVGLSSNSWAVFGGDVLLRNGLTAASLDVGSIEITGCLATDCIVANTGTVINFNSDVQFGNAYATYLSAATIRADTYENLPAPTSNNLIINYNQGWDTPTLVSPSWVPTIGSVYDTLSTAISTDRMITVSIRAEDYRSYGEIFAYVDGFLVAQSKIGNIGLIPNSNVDHALSANMFIDAVLPMTFMVPASSEWYLSAANVYAPLITADIVIFTEQRAWVEVVGDLVTPYISAYDIVTTNLTASNIYGGDGYFDSVTATDVYSPTGIFIAVSAQQAYIDSFNFDTSAISLVGSMTAATFVNPVTADGWLVFNINGVQKALRMYDFTT